MKSILLSALFFYSAFLSAFELMNFSKVKESYEQTLSEGILYDRNGKLLHELRVNNHIRRFKWVPITEVSAAVVEALLIAEDKHFFEHEGVDWKALADGTIRLLTLRGKRGGSTITMQLAGFLNPEIRSRSAGRTISEKWEQIKLAKIIEEKWTKEEILEAYLNLVNFKGELSGIGAASKTLFKKEPHGLEDYESVILVSFIKSPSGSAARISNRACYIAMELNIAKECDAIKEKVSSLYNRNYSVKLNYQLASHLAHKLLNKNVNEVTTTIDRTLQIFARQALANHLIKIRSRNVKDGAVLILDNATGDVLAYIGSSGELSSAKDVDGVQSKRQAGSTLKPFFYGIAFDEKLLKDTSIINDNPFSIRAGNGVYSPANYQDKFYGDVSVRVALASSLNVPAVKVVNMIGPDEARQKLSQLGFSNLEDGDYYGLSLALGSPDISLWELTNAYRVLANNGEFSELNLLLNEKDREKAKIPVFSRETSGLLKDILSDRDARALTFGSDNPLNTRFMTSVKTGTSKDMRDNWCIGFNSKYTVGVWVGNFGGEPMWNVSGVTGAAPIWRDIMNRLGPEEGEVNSAEKSIGKPNTIISSSSKKKNLINRITNPVSESIYAVDPEIPDENQAIFFESLFPDNSVYWKLDDKVLGTAGSIKFWYPKKGRHQLFLLDKNGMVLDKIIFEVR